MGSDGKGSPSLGWVWLGLALAGLISTQVGLVDFSSDGHGSVPNTSTGLSIQIAL